jgi:outer membrane receptor protein involved in Fe transport
VAGFNQFYDDPNATETWVYGAAVDQKFSTNIYGGAEFIRRKMDAPYFIQPPTPGPFVRKVADWDEYIGRAYFYWTPHKWFALRAEYLYEKFERDEEFTFGIKNVKTHRLPLGINFFHPTGLSAGLKGTYHDQKGDFQRQDAQPGEFVSGEDDFWVVDLAINYRLPKRYGLITLGATNLFDKSFRFVDTDVNNPQVQPDRVIFGKVTLALP